MTTDENRKIGNQINTDLKVNDSFSTRSENEAHSAKFNIFCLKLSFSWW
jgi:hypothetical protein